jgi:hypothetical protein
MCSIFIPILPDVPFYVVYFSSRLMANAIVKYMLKVNNVIHVRQVILTYRHPIQRDVTIVAVLPWEPKMGILPVIHLLVFVIAKTMLEVCMKFTSNKILSPGFIVIKFLVQGFYSCS